MFSLLFSLCGCYSPFSFQELQKAVDHRKAIILSINLCSSEFTQAGSEDSQHLQDRLSQMNARWDRVCSLLEDWRGLLQDALMQCQVRGLWAGRAPEPSISRVAGSVTWSIKVTRPMRLLPKVKEWDEFVPKLFILLENLYMWTIARISETPST